MKNLAVAFIIGLATAAIPLKEISNSYDYTNGYVDPGFSYTFELACVVPDALHRAEVASDLRIAIDAALRARGDGPVPAAEPAAVAGSRVVLLRLGVVLSAEGGAMVQMLPSIRNPRTFCRWVINLSLSPIGGMEITYRIHATFGFHSSLTVGLTNHF